MFRPRGSVRFGRLALACAVVVLAGSPVLAEADRPWPVRHRVRVAASALDGRAGALDVAGHDPSVGRVELIVTSPELAELLRIDPTLERIETIAGARPLGASRDAEEATPAGPQYRDAQEVEALLQQTALDHPQITRLETVGTSLEGRPILALMISDRAATDEDEPAVLFSGAHHAREVMTVEVMLDLIEQLTDLYGTDPEITDLVDATRIWCVPVVNPDGLEIVFTEDDLWRKNARDNDGNGRIDWKDGVDLNRNYAWAWGGQCEGSTDWERGATYRGTHAASEPETAAMIALGRRIRPVFDVEFHSYGEDVFYAAGCDPGLFSPRLSTVPLPDRNVGRIVAQDYASHLLRTDGTPGFVAAPFGQRVDGVGRDHQAHEHGSIAFVTEINSYAEGGFQPPYDLRDATVAGQRDGWRWLIGRTHGPAVGGTVIDAVTGLPLEADVSLDEMTLPDGRRLTSEPAYGRFHLIVVPGSYTLRVRADGYDEAVIQQVVGSAWQPLVVSLQPDGSAAIARFDFEGPAGTAGWQAGGPGDTASAGTWVADTPLGTWIGDALAGDLQHVAAAFDRTPGTGSVAWVTGNAANVGANDDDVDGGFTTLTSPALDLAGRYGVELAWWQWVHTDPADPLDGLRLELSEDGGNAWVPAGAWPGEGTPPLGPGWERLHVRLDDRIRPSQDTRIRFVAVDDGADHAVEAAVDDVFLGGFDLATDGEVRSLGFRDGSTTRISWQAVPGGADATYDLLRGDLATSGLVAGAVDLGPLTCLEGLGSGPGETYRDDTEIPPPASAWFYLARFRLGASTGGLGAASTGAARLTAETCGP